MSTHPAPARGLSTTEIEEIRAGLTAGRKPKVMFTTQAGQIAGQVGQVVSLDDPGTSDEWLVVRFGKDELPFSPADLAIPPKGRPARAATGGGAAASAVPEPRPADPSPAAATGEGGATGSRGDGPKADGAKAERADAKPARRARSGKGGKPKPPPAMTVTLAYEAGEWTVAAAQGNRVLAKPYVVRPAEALRMVGMLDVPGVQEAVEQIVAAELAEARQRAEALRSELAEVEARLAELNGAAGRDDVPTVG